MNESMKPPDLLRAAAKLIERALIGLDMKEAPCPHCDTTLFRNRDHAKIYEQLTDSPTKLRNAADKLDQAVLPDGTPRQSSRGYATASK